MVILLNEQNNKNNWFSAGQPDSDGFVLPNSFVHTGNWEMFLPHDAYLPIAFTVIEEIIRYGMAINYNKLDQYSHTPSIGCINDMCQEKKDVILSMRTADLCERCVNQLLDADRLSALQIHELMFGAEKIREQLLFRQGFRKWVGFSRLTVDDEARIMLPDYGQLQLQLNPMQKTLYVFFLLLPETGEPQGTQSMPQFLQQHKAKLMRLYQIFGGNSERPIQNLIDNSWTQQVARIRREINEKLCFVEETMRQQYVITGEVNGPKRIAISRNLVKLPNWLNT